MFGIEFMSGSLAGLFAQYLVWLAIALVILSLFWGFYPRQKYYRITQVIMFVAITILFASLALSSQNQPKRVLMIPMSESQIQYNTPKEVIIVTPPARTEKLERFTPMGQ